MPAKAGLVLISEMRFRTPHSEIRTQLVSLRVFMLPFMPPEEDWFLLVECVSEFRIPKSALRI
jgi:hypothetical protein